ncbi:MnhB domain-containing protein [Candidatus Eisenbacteria bacterium]|uniref:MnhB domain-containing protein n=1 Tax=Eiseniibacteriota bacterium TaxID=2212470 RepID=A0ABV6YJS6_UNCEI
MIRREDSIITDVVTRIMVPLIQIFAFYVIFHGHYSPGGGFQGGALLAGSVLLQRVVFGRDRSLPGFHLRLGIPFGVIGVLIFAGTGFAAQALGGNYLQYEFLPFGLSPVWLRNTGILMVEIGVAFAVMGILISIFDNLVGDPADEEVE